MAMVPGDRVGSESYPEWSLTRCKQPPSQLGVPGSWCQGGLAWCNQAQSPSPCSSREVDGTAPLPVGGCSYIQGHTGLHLINKTVGQCLDATVQKIPDREALVVLHENVRLTFAQLKEEVGPDLEPSK